MLSTVFLLLTIGFLIGTAMLTMVNSAVRRIHKRETHKQFKLMGRLFLYRPFHLFFFPEHEYEGIFLANYCALNITRFCYTVSMLGFLTQTNLFMRALFGDSLAWLWIGLWILFFLLFVFAIGDYFPRIIGNRFPTTSLRIAIPLASFFMFLAFPFTYLFQKVSQSLSSVVPFETSVSTGKDEIIEMIRKAELSPTFDVHDRELIGSAMQFKDRIAREVMVPRVEVFSLSADLTIREAAQLLAGEGYSRIPIYRNTVDNIVGVLMYKDVLKKYMEFEQQGRNPQILEEPIETLQKPVLHTPETKKISSLLQEFRKKQLHLAIVVDEYGGTEGIVTIEDILEEIVGDISDEYDQEEELYYAQADGSWVVDARMNISDAEEELGIKIPQEGEYDTVGGYIFHTTGTIPAKGFIIHHDEFDMEILKSNDRCVEKVRIRPVITPNKEVDTDIVKNSEGQT